MSEFKEMMERAATLQKAQITDTAESLSRLSGITVVVSPALTGNRWLIMASQEVVDEIKRLTTTHTETAK